MARVCPILCASKQRKTAVKYNVEDGVVVVLDCLVLHGHVGVCHMVNTKVVVISNDSHFLLWGAWDLGRN